MKVLIAEFMDAQAVTALRSRFDTLYEPQLVDRRPELLERVGDADAVIVRNRTRVDRALLEAAQALRDGHLGGAALDVFECEPLVAGSPLAGTPNLILTPHIAGITRQTTVSAA